MSGEIEDLLTLEGSEQSHVDCEEEIRKIAVRQSSGFTLLIHLDVDRVGLRLIHN